MVQQKTVRACIWRYVFDRHNVIDSGPSDGWVFSLSGEAFAITVQLLQTFSICAMLIWPLSFALPNVLRAAGDAKYTMEVSVFSMWVFRVASSYFFAGTLKMGVLGVWIGMYVDWVFRSLLFVIRYKRGKWLNKRVV